VEEAYRYDDNDGKGVYRVVQMYKKKNPNFYEVKSPSGKKWNMPWNYTKENFLQMDEDNKVFGGTDGNAQPQKKSIFQRVPE
jgi:hypothetical protein